MDKYLIDIRPHGRPRIAKIEKETAKSFQIREEWEGRWANVVTTRRKQTEGDVIVDGYEEAQRRLQNATAAWEKEQEQVKTAEEVLRFRKTVQREAVQKALNGN